MNGATCNKLYVLSLGYDNVQPGRDVIRDSEVLLNEISADLLKFDYEKAIVIGDASCSFIVECLNYNLQNLLRPQSLPPYDPQNYSPRQDRFNSFNHIKFEHELFLPNDGNVTFEYQKKFNLIHNQIHYIKQKYSDFSIDFNFCDSKVNTFNYLTKVGQIEKSVPENVTLRLWTCDFSDPDFENGRIEYQLLAGYDNVPVSSHCYTSGRSHSFSFGPNRGSNSSHNRGRSHSFSFGQNCVPSPSFGSSSSPNPNLSLGSMCSPSPALSPACSSSLSPVFSSSSSPSVSPMPSPPASPILGSSPTLSSHPGRNHDQRTKSPHPFSNLPSVSSLASLPQFFTTTPINNSSSDGSSWLPPANTFEYWL